MNGAKKAKRLLLPSLAVASALLPLGVCRAQASSAPRRTQQVEAPTPKDAVSPQPVFADARRLSQQGKFDEAIAQLEALAAKQPDAKGLAHELGIVYYKKGDYLKAVANFKKALDENPGDSEAIQLMGLSHYLAGRPADAIAPL